MKSDMIASRLSQACLTQLSRRLSEDHSQGYQQQVLPEQPCNDLKFMTLASINYSTLTSLRYLYSFQSSSLSFSSLITGIPFIS